MFAHPGVRLDFVGLNPEEATVFQDRYKEVRVRRPKNVGFLKIQDNDIPIGSIVVPFWDTL